MTISRRSFLASAGAVALAPAALAGAAERFEVTRTPDQWRRLLGPARYAVLREAKTERAGSSPLDREKRRGIFVCAGCALPLYKSQTKFDSGTGWPSFWAPIPNAVRMRPEGRLFWARTEVHCRRCGGHLGHVFDDGPGPTGQRFCMNSCSLQLEPRGS